MKRSVWLALAASAIIAPGLARAAQDDRGFQHGISFVDLPDGSYEVFWSGQGNPPSPPPVHWTHDIYHWHVDRTKPSIDANAAPTIIARPEAQEPVSAAMTADGHIMLVTEDGWDTPKTICERYGVYDAKLNPILPYPQMVFDGAHSAHVAAVQNRFVVFYSDQWIEGGGVDNLGSGKDVVAAIYDSAGKPLFSPLNLTASPRVRDWWPVVAGSASRALLVWQRYVENETYANLMVAVIDPMTGALVMPPKQLDTRIDYYHYSVAFLPAVDRFLVRGTYQDGRRGFGYLLDESGGVVATSPSLAPIVRESQSIVRNDTASALVVQPAPPTGLSVLRVTATTIESQASIADDHLWDYSGTDGRFVDPHRVFVAALSTTGMWTKSYADIPDGAESTRGASIAPTVLPARRPGACGCDVLGERGLGERGLGESGPGAWGALGGLGAVGSLGVCIAIALLRRGRRH